MTHEEACKRIVVMMQHCKSSDDAETLNFALGCTIFCKNISTLPDCNTCGNKHSCEYVPRVGAYTRINCPHYSAEK